MYGYLNINTMFISFYFSYLDEVHKRITVIFENLGEMGIENYIRALFQVMQAGNPYFQKEGNLLEVSDIDLIKQLSDLAFYCEKYTYHFLTIAICWCHPTHWPTLRNVLRNLKRPVSECELACPPSGHVTTLVNNLHYFCWPS